VVEALDDVKLKFAIVLFWTLDATVVPTDRLIPRNRFAIAPAIVQAVPPALAAPPPMKLLLTTKLLPELFEIVMPDSVADVVSVLVAVW
jgi:hypothetical protein